MSRTGFSRGRKGPVDRGPWVCDSCSGGALGLNIRLTSAVYAVCLVVALSGAACAETPSETSSVDSSPLAVGGGSLPTASPVATPQATPLPPPPPTAAPVVAAPAPAPPAANSCGAPSNPWGYSFCAGTFISTPPPNFCSYFSCIPSFWKFTNGYVEQCKDGMYSHSGGRSGSCSSHHGNNQPLYGS
jgi:hypothetical protein